MSSIINADTSNGLKLTSDTSGEIKLQSAGADIATVDSSGITMAAGKTLPASALTGSLPAGMGGKILQVLQVQKTDVFSTTSSTLVDVTGLTLTITPSSASNKILFMAFVGGVGTDNSVVQAVRDSTIIAAGAAAGSRTQSFAGSFYNGIYGPPAILTATINWLDTPATTSAVTYKIKAGAVGGGTLYLGRNATDTDNAQYTRVPQVITLMEVAG